MRMNTFCCTTLALYFFYSQDYSVSSSPLLGFEDYYLDDDGLQASLADDPLIESSGNILNDNSSSTYYGFDVLDEEEDEFFGRQKVVNSSPSPEPNQFRPCPSPNVTFNGSISHPSEWAASDKSGTPVRDVEFEVQVGPFPKDLQKCKLTCQDGHWIGPLCRKSNDKTYHSLLKSCELNLHPANIIITYQFQELKLSQSTVFPDGDIVEFRCFGSPGDYFIEGNSSLTCHNGIWDSRIPFCRKTSSRANFSEDEPPRLVVHSSVNGVNNEEEDRIITGPSGEVLIYPGSILHIDCVYSRKKGNPQWSWSRHVKVYPTGWSVMEVDRDWHYRLSLYYECPKFEISDVELESRLRSHKVGSIAAFSCPRGFKLVGPSSLLCLRNGSWSGTPPLCQPIKCTALEILDSHLRVLSLNNSYLGTANFLCPFGYKLEGPETISCGHEGFWNGVVPRCKAIECASPLPPSNGRLLDNDKYLVGNTVQYVCDEGFVLIGEPIIRCTESGLWSHATPFCKRACRFPGDPMNGRIMPVKFLYEIGDKILIECNSGYVNTGRPKAICNEDGKWSETIPSCLSYLNSSS
ncbi:locomotion-related protein Hikaru genki [Lepeophtheirus salmonis]|uniref:locomotion-related protein Hikaru genki n=1 Tax=Lepeophtheirus salmonis TaxID=72036 RepID=UPI003AF380ED